MAETAATATTQKGISAEDNAVLRKMFIMSHSVFMNFNMTKMEANCFTNTMAPAIEQVYVDDPEGKREAYLRHQAFFNTHAVALDFIAGLSYALEKDCAEGKVPGQTIEAIKAKGVLVVTTEAGYAPFEFLDENDNVVGLDASLAQALADDLGVELDIQNIAFDSVVAEVQAGNADMAIAGLTPNADRKKSVDMSDMYYAGGQCMLVLEENLDKYATKESLAGAVMATQKAALQETLMAEQFPDAEPLLLPDFPQCIANLKNGECAAVMIDEISAEQYMQTVEGLAIGKVPVEIDPEEGGNAVAVMKGNTDLLDWVNERIAAYEAEGLLEQWFQEAQEKAASMGIE